MAKKICRRLEYMYPDQVESKNWNEIPLKSDATLQCECRSEPSGYIDENSITAIIEYDPAYPLILQPYPVVILRAFTSEGEVIIIGSDVYPAIVEYTDDRLLATLTFTQRQPHS